MVCSRSGTGLVGEWVGRASAGLAGPDKQLPGREVQGLLIALLEVSQGFCCGGCRLQIAT